MKLLSVDQSSTCSGLSIFEYSEENADYQLIWHDKYKPLGNDFEEKMLNLANYIDKLIKREEIEMILLENVQAQTNLATHKKLCMLLGALIEVTDINNIDYTVISSNSWRKLLHAKKGMKRKELKQLAKNYVFDKFEIESSEDEADSICMACYYYEELFSID